MKYLIKRSAAITIHSQNLYKRGAPEGVKVAWMKNASTFAATNVTFDAFIANSTTLTVRCEDFAAGRRCSILVLLSTFTNAGKCLKPTFMHSELKLGQERLAAIIKNKYHTLDGLLFCKSRGY